MGRVGPAGFSFVLGSIHSMNTSQGPAVCWALFCAWRCGSGHVPVPLTLVVKWRETTEYMDLCPVLGWRHGNKHRHRYHLPPLLHKTKTWGKCHFFCCCLRWRSSCGLPLGERVYSLPPGLSPLSSVALRVTPPLHQWSGGLLCSPMVVAAPKASTQAFPQELSSVSDSYFLWVALEFTPFFVFRLGLLMITKSSFQKASFLV